MATNNGLALPCGVVRRQSMPSRTLGVDWKYILYTPPGYEPGGGAVPVIYLLHGNFGTPDDYIDQGGLPSIADRLIASGAMAPAIIAMPYGGQSWYLDQPGLPMEDAILHEFIPFIEKSERVTVARANRRIGGISMGGYGSLRFALRHPEYFSALALMSPAVYGDLPPPNSSARHAAPFCAADDRGKPVFSAQAWQACDWPAYLGSFEPARWPLRIWLECGATDEFGLADEARRLRDALVTRGLDPAFRLRPGGHDWATWTAALPDVLSFLAPPEALSA